MKRCIAARCVHQAAAFKIRYRERARHIDVDSEAKCFAYNEPAAFGVVRILALLAAGLPCFKIASEEERSRGPVSLKMLTISTPGPNGWNNVWTVMFPNASFGDPSYRLPNRGCVLYGEAPEGAESSDAAPLVAGKVYGYPS